MPLGKFLVLITNSYICILGDQYEAMRAANLSGMYISSLFTVNLSYFVATFFRCGHCKKLKPEYAKAAELIKYNDPPVVFAKVDCTEAGKETCNKFSVTGYQTLKIFRDGEFSEEYNGPREAGQFQLML